MKRSSLLLLSLSLTASLAWAATDTSADAAGSTLAANAASSATTGNNFAGNKVVGGRVTGSNHESSGDSRTASDAGREIRHYHVGKFDYQDRERDNH